MGEIIYIIKLTFSSPVGEEMSMIVYATTDYDKLVEQVRDNSLFSAENKDIYIYMFEDGLLSRAYPINVSNYDQVLDIIKNLINR